MTDLEKMLKRHEGEKLYPYKDTVGKITISVGVNISDGIDQSESDWLFRNRLKYAMDDLTNNFYWFRTLDSVRRDALIDMTYNLGINKFREFKQTIQYLSEGDWPKAAVEMLDSTWAKQVGNRAKELSEMIRTGKYAIPT